MSSTTGPGGSGSRGQSRGRNCPTAAVDGAAPLAGACGRPGVIILGVIILDFHLIPAHTTVMRKRLRIARAVLVVALVGLALWQGLREPEPVYQGKRLGRWLSAAVASGANDDGLPMAQHWGLPKDLGFAVCIGTAAQPSFY